MCVCVCVCVCVCLCMCACHKFDVSHYNNVPDSNKSYNVVDCYLFQSVYLIHLSFDYLYLLFSYSCILSNLSKDLDRSLITKKQSLIQT